MTTSRYTGWAGRLEEVGRFEWERIIKKCSFHQPSTKLLALVLATYANSEDGTNVRPGRERLIAASGLSKGYVSAQLGKLEDMGMIFKVHNGSSYGRRGGLASVYQLTVPHRIREEYQEDPEGLEPIPIEWAWQAHLHPEQVHPSGHDRASESQEHVHSDKEHVHSVKEHVHSEAEQVRPSGPHQPINTNQESPSKNHQSSFAASSPSLTHARAAVDNSYINGSYTGAGMEDERQRQMAALQQLIEQEERQAS